MTTRDARPLTTTHGTVRLSYQGRAFDITPIYRKEPDWEWTATVTEIDVTTDKVIAGRGILGQHSHPRIAVTNAIGQLLEDIDQGKPVLPVR
jgi:hypothetical protein